METELTEQKPHWSIRVILGRRPKWTFVRILFWVASSFLLFKFVLVPIRVRGESMNPTLRNGSIHLVNRWAYRWHPPQRGDIVTVTVENHGLFLVKRVVAMPGERFSVHDGSVFIDGDRLNEPYLKQPTLGKYREVKLLPSHYIVMGDNRAVSETWERDMSEVLGKVLF
ncbi:MAG: signal peptidase [Verrucomicrobiales bacterium]|nr:signal peptidase [Verrucomicrobiales bacterium]